MRGHDFSRADHDVARFRGGEGNKNTRSLHSALRLIKLIARLRSGRQVNTGESAFNVSVPPFSVRASARYDVNHPLAVILSHEEKTRCVN